jgi:hypothetical protein
MKILKTQMKEIKTNDERRSIPFLLLRKEVWVFILFLNIQTFSQIYNDGKNTILYGSENIVEILYRLYK